jgi:hypothetical protein
MMTYTLTAELNGKIEATPIEAYSDNDAMMGAIAKIMNRAAENPTGPWGKGEIRLTNEAGELIESMPAK